MVILHICCPDVNLVELWRPVYSMTPILNQYLSKPCLQTAVRYFVEGVRTPLSNKFEITFGTMCSGTDYVSEVLCCVRDAFHEKCGNTFRLALRHLFVVEINSDMQQWCKLQSAELGFHPKVYSDMNSLPLQDMQRCDVLFAGTSCKGLSSLNTNKRSLADVDPTNPLCSSGNTMRGYPCCIKGIHYVNIVNLNSLIYFSVGVMPNSLLYHPRSQRSAAIFVQASA